MSLAFRGVALAATLLVVSACGSEVQYQEATRVGSEGGIVPGPDGLELRIPERAVPPDREIAFSISRVDPEYDTGLGLGELCGPAYLISPASFEFLVPASLRLPEESCMNAAALLAPPVTPFWMALTSNTGEGYRTVDLPRGGLVGVGSLHVEPSMDETLYVGSTLSPRVTDWRGRGVNHAWVWSRSSDTEIMAPDNVYADGKQRAKSPGVVGLTVSVPVMNWEKNLEIRVIRNPAAQLRVVRGQTLHSVAGSATEDSVIVEVRDGQDQPLGNVWVDFVFGDDRNDTRQVVFSGPTDQNGRAGSLIRAPTREGRHVLLIRLPGTDLQVNASLEVTSAP